MGIKKERKEETYKIVISNFMRHAGKTGYFLRRDKLKAYIKYREAREKVRDHDAFVESVKERGIDALLSSNTLIKGNQ